FGPDYAAKPRSETWTAFPDSRSRRSAGRRRAPSEVEAPRRLDVVEPAHRRAPRRRLDALDVAFGFPGDRDHRVHEAIERFAAFRLGGLGFAAYRPEPPQIGRTHAQGAAELRPRGVHRS